MLTEVVISSVCIVALCFCVVVLSRKLDKTRHDLEYNLDVNKSLSCELRRYQDLYRSLETELYGWGELEAYGAENVEISCEDDIICVDIWAPTSGKKLTIKTYEYGDDDDCEYAIRCAEELIDKLKE